MNSFIRNSGAVLLGVFVGAALNMEIIMVSGRIIPMPKGTDIKSAEGLINGMHLMEPQHFILPFIAHALGTFVGATIAALIGSTKKLILAIIVGLVFLLGGIADMNMIPTPIWFTFIDLTLSYLPMALLGFYFSTTFQKKIH
jgi:hypothetical protein